MSLYRRIAAIALSLAMAFTLYGCADDVRPPDAAFGQTFIDAASCSAPGEPTCPGETAPEFSLEDFQPQSDTFGEKRALSDYKGKTTVVALLAGW